MAVTVQVCQSCPENARSDWLNTCLDSVRAWCRARGYDHQLIGDELFDLIDPALLSKTCAQPVIATDLARLRLLQQRLLDGASAAIWLDADTLIFAPDEFEPLAADHAVGREIWVQVGKHRRLQVHRQVHNAFLLVRAGNSFLDFYADTAERLLRENRGGMPPQFIGPKLLTALHNVVQLPVQEDAGSLSPLVIRALLGDAPAPLERLRSRMRVPFHAVNLCQSSLRDGQLEPSQMQAVAELLLARGAL